MGVLRRLAAVCGILRRLAVFRQTRHNRVATEYTHSTLPVRRNTAPAAPSAPAPSTAS